MKRVLFLAAWLLFGRPLFAQNNGATLPALPPGFFLSTGIPANGAKLCTTASGTSNNLATYSDAALTAALPNPITLSVGGIPQTSGNALAHVFIQAKAYRVTLYLAGTGNTCNGVPVGTQIWQFDNIYDFAQIGVFISINNRQFCVTGANAGAKIVAAIALLPSTGGIVDCSNLQGPQTISQDIFAGVAKPVQLLLGGATFTTTGASWSIASNREIIGIGDGTIIQWNGSGFLLDKNNNTTPGADNIVLRDFMVNVSASGAGFLRVGDRTSAFDAAGINEQWDIQNINVYGQAAGVGMDLTEFFNSKVSRILVNNFPTQMKLTTLSQSSFDNIVLSTSATNGLYIINNQAGATPGSVDGTTFTNLAVEGITGGNAIDIDRANNGTFTGVFIERTSGTPTAAIKLEAASGNRFYGVATSFGANFANLIDALDSYDTLFNAMQDGNLGAALTVSVGYTSPQTINAYSGRGNIRFENCAYQVNLAARRIPWVTVIGDDKFPGSLSFGRLPVTGLTGGFVKSVLNHQGNSNLPETDIVLDAFHGQDHYNDDNLAKVVTDTATSSGFAVQMTNGTFYGFKFDYPSQIPLGTYELIVRGKVSAGASAPSVFVGNSGALGAIFNAPWANFTTAYQVFSVRFTLTAANVVGFTNVTATVIAAPGVGNTWSIDYMVLRPVANDVILQPYVAPDSQINDPTGGAVLGTRLTTAASIPTTGAYVIGDVVYNTAPAANEPTVGWYRLVTGTAHVLGTDWAALNIPTDVKFGTNSISFTWAGSDCQTGTITANGSQPGGANPAVVVLGLPSSWPANTVAQGVVTGANTVTVTACKLTAGGAGPASYQITAEVRKVYP